MILCIVGSYAWRDKDVPKAKQMVADVIAVAVKAFGSNLTVISGACPKGGVDIWAEAEAHKQGVKFLGFPPIANNKKAYMNRNMAMVAACDTLVRITSPISKTRGSGITAQWAREAGKRVMETKVEAEQ